MKNPLVQVKNIGMSFGATRALDNVSFDFYPGEIMALVGANGAGKSTLIKIICGYYPDYEGEVYIDGQLVHFNSPRDADQKGIKTVHQIINHGVIPDMTVAENLALEDLLTDSTKIFTKQNLIKEKAKKIADQMDLSYLDLDQKVEELDQSDRQMIIIARALASNPKLLILDEPTSSLSSKEADRLFELLDRLRAKGVSILYVSHRLHEIKRIADRVGVIRDGKQAGVLVKPFEVKEIVTAMVGEIKTDRGARQINRSANDKVKIELRNLVVEEGNAPLNLQVYTGEILGITGLIGAGKSELAEVLFGIRKPVSGEVYIDGKKVDIDGIADAINKGIFLVPEDRNNNAIIPEYTIRYNMVIPFLRSFSKFGLMKDREEAQTAAQMVKNMGIKCSGEDALIESLSGGNQQKVVVARWLLKHYNLLILDEPFQGVDIKSRHDICDYLRANIGDQAIIVMATDLDEAIEIADRIVVLNTGKLVGQQLADQIDRSQLLHWISQSPDSI